MIKINIETDTPSEAGTITGVIMKHFGKMGTNNKIEIPVPGHQTENGKSVIEIFIK